MFCGICNTAKPNGLVRAFRYIDQALSRLEELRWMGSTGVARCHRAAKKPGPGLRKGTWRTEIDRKTDLRRSDIRGP